MKLFTYLLFTLGVIINAQSQSMLIWSRNFTAPMPYSDYNGPTIQLLGDTIQVCGRSTYPTGEQLSLVNYSLEGEILSQKQFENTSLNNSTILDFKFDSNNSVYVLHEEEFTMFKSKIVLQKFDSEANLQWSSQIQSATDTSYVPYKMGIIGDSCVIISAYQEYNFPVEGSDINNTIIEPFIFGMSSTGNVIFRRQLNQDTELTRFMFGNLILNGSAYIFGYNYDDSFSNPNFLKVESNGELTKSENFNVLNGMSEVQLTPDSNLLITSGGRYRISKIDLSGNLVWTRSYTTNLPSNVGGDNIYATFVDELGNIFITGSHFGEGYGTPEYSGSDVVTLKYDSYGNLLWSNRYKLDNQNYEAGNDVVLKDGSVYVGAKCQRSQADLDLDYLVIKIDQLTGFTEGVYRFNGEENDNDAITSIAVFDNGSVAITGQSVWNNQNNWTTQLLSDVNSLFQPYEEIDLTRVYPNPVLSGTQIGVKGGIFDKYMLFSSTGQLVQQGQLSSSNEFKIALPNLSSGLYILQLQSEKQLSIRKIQVN